MTDLIPTNDIQKLAELDVQYDKIKKQRDELRARLLEKAQELDVWSLKTGTYTLYRAKRLTPRVTSMKALKTTLEAEKIPYDTMEVFTPQTFAAFRLLAKEGRQLEGLEVQETEYVAIKTQKGGE